jgi:RNA polymerase sigma-70 factor (ECF subfamily)
MVLAYFGRRTHDAEAAADLTAETFAAVIAGRHRYRGSGTPATVWLFAIARRKLADYQRRGYADDRLRRRVGIERPRLGEDDAALIGLLADDSVLQLMEQLPADQRAAVRQHVLDGRPYDDIADALQTSEAVVRKRVSRGLHALRDRLELRK